MSDTVTVPGIPFDLAPSDDTPWTVDDGTVTVHATAHSDIFVDPGGGTQANAETQLNAATLLGDPPAGDFQFSARVSVGFVDTFDAGVLLLWFDEHHWGKLCFEFSPDREPMVVSVVARGVADDANAFVVDRGDTVSTPASETATEHAAGPDFVWLRVSRVGAVFSYHASLDGERWRLVRAFALDPPEPSATVRLGFEAQSPVGEGCVVTFSDVSFASTTLTDIRDGS
ncbi:DUF1349 domain-containing protein [Marisediminicola sp. LYQ134]|uniref:DUF1349 domain-containing protein n=1 Tax=Marisediminicola sp. LYQ134 TaxID=3391061 RepID=UPI0039833E29